MINVDKNTKPNIHERLRSISETNKYRKQGECLSRTFLKTSNANNDLQQQKITEIEEEKLITETKNINAKIITETTSID